MEKKNKKSINKGFYIITVFILATVMVIGIITSMGTATKKEDLMPKTKTTQKTAQTTAKEQTNDKTAPKHAISDTQGPEENTAVPSSDAPSADTTGAESHDDTPAASLPSELFLPVTGSISKAYSNDTPVFSLTMNDYRTHRGIDIACESGTAVSAFANGVISNRYTDPFMGVCLEITHGGGYTSRYMNMGESFPEQAQIGASVKGGQPVGCVGKSAAIEAADSSHLHFEILKDGKQIDPLELIDYEFPADTSFED